MHVFHILQDVIRYLYFFHKKIILKKCASFYLLFLLNVYISIEYVQLRLL